MAFAVCFSAVPYLGAQSEEDFVYALLDLVPEESMRNVGLTVFPILYFPVGGEQQSMGMAYTAVSRDISFFEANPGASPLLDITEASVYHSNPFRTVNLESFAYTQRIGDLGFGGFFRLLHTDFSAIGIRGEQLAASAYTESLLGLNIGYTFLRDFYFSGISVGANLKIAYRNIPEELYSHVTGLDGTDQSAAGVMGDFGILTRFNFLKGYISRDKNLSLGIAFKNLGPLVLDEPLPTTLSFGLAYQPFRFLLLAGDLNIPVNLQDPDLSEDIGFAAGTALQFVDFFSIKGGVQLRGNSYRFTMGTTINLESVSFVVTYTVDASTEFKIPDHLSVQAKLNLGDGGRAALAKRVDDLYIDALVALSVADYQTVIDLCMQALALDPGYTPAKETLELAQRSQSLLDQIESIRLQEPQSEE